MDRDYFEVLGVSRDADEETVPRAYRKLSLKYHPDMNPGDKDAEANFREITKAYEVLNDPNQRRRYQQSAGVTLSRGATAAVLDDCFRRFKAAEEK